MDDFYVWYYVGYKGWFGYEFFEFEFCLCGKFWYVNNLNYKNDMCICKEMMVLCEMLNEVVWIIKESEVMKEDDWNWFEFDCEGW